MFSPFFFSVLGYNFFSFEIILIAKLTFLCPNKPYEVPICTRCGAPRSPGDRESYLQSCFLSPRVAVPFCFVLSPGVMSQGNRVSPSPGKNFLGISSIHPPHPFPQEGFTNEQKQCRNPVFKVLSSQRVQSKSIGPCREVPAKSQTAPGDALQALVNSASAWGP